MTPDAPLTPEEPRGCPTPGACSAAETIAQLRADEAQLRRLHKVDEEEWLNEARAYVETIARLQDALATLRAKLALVEWWDCPECKTSHVRVGEDCCCVICGEDATLMRGEPVDLPHDEDA